MLYQNQEFYSPKNQQDNRSLPIKSDGNIDVDVILGMSSKNCQFHGICKINPSSNMSHEDFMNSKDYLKNSLRGVLCLDSKKKLILKFDRKTITPYIQKKYLKDDLFIINESLEMPSFVSLHFGTSFTVKEGTYPIKKGKKYCQIVLN